MNAQQIATVERNNFRSVNFAGRAEVTAIIAFRTLTLVRLGKADPTVAATILRGEAHRDSAGLPFRLWSDLLRVADAIVEAA
jgi:hypothetical protein